MHFGPPGNRRPTNPPIQTTKSSVLSHLRAVSPLEVLMAEEASFPSEPLPEEPWLSLKEEGETATQHSRDESWRDDTEVKALLSPFLCDPTLWRTGALPSDTGFLRRVIAPKHLIPQTKGLLTHSKDSP